MKDKFKKFLNYLDKHRLPVWCILLLALVLNATLSLAIMSYGNKI